MKKAKEKEHKAAEKKRKAELHQQRNGGRSTRSHNKENMPSTCEGNVESTIPSAKADQQNECSVCLGKYEDDFVEGVLQKEWIQCENCGLWMHSDCLIMDGNNYVCVLCNAVFK